MAEPHGFRHYFRSHFLDKTFLGLYHANAFDLALLLPYFVVLILLAFYGMHRYQLVYLYYKHRKNKVTEPESHFAVPPSNHVFQVSEETSSWWKRLSTF